MPSGGARARSGPAKDPTALRRERDGFSSLRLPLDGRPGDPPDWPSSQAAPSARMKRAWTELWRLPQAVAWERLRMFEQVAVYVRCMVAAEAPHASAADRRLAAQLMPPLGLTHDGLAKNGWAIEEEQEAAPATAPATVISIRDRLRPAAGE